jgi:adenosylcobinamide-GDP ribazoletransferase
MKPFILALQFLTRIPVKIKSVGPHDLGRSIIYFPAVGALIGALLCGLAVILGIMGIDSLIISTIVVVALIIITGGIHLDGLSDTFDALLSGKDRTEMLKIMRDPHVGVMGVLSIVSAVMLKIALLYSMSGIALMYAILSMCILGRWSMVISMQIAPYARENGKAKSFIEGIKPAMTIIASVVTLVIVLLMWRLAGLVLYAAIGVSAIFITRLLQRKLGGITGDTLGALNEMMEILALFIICLIQIGH